MKVECNRCKKLFTFDRDICVGTGYFQKKDIQLCEKCEKELWKFINGEKYEVN